MWNERKVLLFRSGCVRELNTVGQGRKIQAMLMFRAQKAAETFEVLKGLVLLLGCLKSHSLIFWNLIYE